MKLLVLDPPKNHLKMFFASKMLSLHPIAAQQGRDFDSSDRTLVSLAAGIEVPWQPWDREGKWDLNLHRVLDWVRLDLLTSLRLAFRQK